MPKFRFDQYLTILFICLFLLFPNLTEFEIQKVKGVNHNVETIALLKPSALPLKKIDAPIEPNISAKSYLVIDLDCAAVLLAKNPEEKLFPASTTKIMTALVARKNFNLDESIEINNITNEGHILGLVNGERMTVRDLIIAMMVGSANDAAYALAGHMPGGMTTFVTEMNTLAQTFKLTETTFTNPAGFDDYAHLSSAKDLITISKIALQDPFLTSIASFERVTLQSEDGQIKHQIVNTNQLVGKVPGVRGLKTGTSPLAGQVLITFFENNGHRLLLAVMGSEDRYNDTEKLLSYILDNFDWKEIDIY